MEFTILDSLTRSISVYAITGYQKYISPYKGFACAHRVLHGGESCSQYIKRSIIQEGLQIGIAKSRLRFQACQEANEILQLRKKLKVIKNTNILSKSLKEQILESTEENISDDISINDPQSSVVKPPKRHSNRDSNNCDRMNCSIQDCNWIADFGCDCASIAELSNLDCGIGDCHAFDCGAADCSTLDCSNMDCGFLDCGGCGN